MADVHVTWYSIDDNNITILKHDMRELATELNMPVGPLTRERRSHLFGKAVDRAVVKYLADDGAWYRVTGVEWQRRTEFVTYNVVREDGLLLAKLKVFQARRTREGIVRGSHVTKAAIRTSLPDGEKLAAKAWVEEAEALFREEQGVAPWYTIRKMLHETMLQTATPIARRHTMFFVYPDEMSGPLRVQEFLARAAPSAQFALLPIESNSDVTVFAQSADAHLYETVRHLVAIVKGWSMLAEWRRKKLSAATAEWAKEYAELHARHALHLERLGRELPRTREALDEAYDVITAMDQQNLLGMSGD